MRVRKSPASAGDAPGRGRPIKEIDVANRTCEVEGCDKPGVRRGWCFAHYARWRKYGDPLADRRPKRGTCSIEGCDKICHARGWCGTHYQQWLTHGDPLADNRPQKGICSIAACGQPRLARGWCEKHYRKWKRYGDPLHEPQDLRARLLSSIEERGPGECWPWTGTLTPMGYGRLSVNDAPVSAHRMAYEVFTGPIPADRTIDHLCHKHDECEGGKSCPHRRCCNPAHLGIAPMVANVMRGNNPFAKNARKTHCPRGHPYDEANTVIESGKRVCRACKIEKLRKYRQCQKAA
jgi:hypothetical protein